MHSMLPETHYGDGISFIMSITIQKGISDFSFILAETLIIGGAGAFSLLAIVATGGPFTPEVSVVMFAAALVAVLMLAIGFALLALSEWIAPQQSKIVQQIEPEPELTDGFLSLSLVS